MTKMEKIAGAEADGQGVGTEKVDDRLGFDPAALWARYQAEREKRLRPEGNKQYIPIEGDYDHYATDPWLTDEISRAPVSEDVEVAIIGGGFGGLLTGARLAQHGVKDVCIIEKGGDFGGTWYWNRYPGVACDVESLCYLPMLEEMGFVPSEKYPKGAEIQTYCRSIAERFGLYDHAYFGTRVTELNWNDDLSRWIVRTNRGDQIRARFAVAANGFLHLPKLPGIPGLTRFKGKSFHTSRWDYDYTGGDTNGNLTNLTDKTVALIGTGATAVQCIPYLGEWAKQLFVFQRTPSAIGVRNNGPVDEAAVRAFEAGWQKQRMENFTSIVTGGREEKDLVNDFWTRIAFNVSLLEGPGSTALELAEASGFNLRQLADFQVMEDVRRRVDEIVTDPATAELLKPYYNLMCKRPCTHDGYLETFNRPNVILVDTSDHGGVEEITEDGVVVGGKEYKVDCIIFGTGFEIRTNLTRQGGYDIHGRDGLSLTEKWKNGDATMHGVASHDFPNCFFVNYSQAGLSANFVHFIDEQCKHIAYLIEEATRRDLKTIEVSEEGERQWVETIVSTASGATLVSLASFQDTCTPGYYNDEGVKGRPAQSRSYAPGLVPFVRLLEAWRESGTLEGMDLTPR
jgi:cation diffusion facilitator CzcD-associated flavoprotein CzcO